MNTKFISLLSILLLLLNSCDNGDYIVEEKSVPSSTIDVYIAGQENDNACYWKNGIKTSLTNGAGITASKIIVDNNNVYVFGSKYISYYVSEYYIWVNNTRYELESYLGIPSASITHFYDFTVKNGTELFAGYVDNSPSGTNTNSEMCYWKNGVKTILQTNTNFIYPLSVDYYDNSVYFSVSGNYPTTGYYKDNIYYTTIGGEWMQNFAKSNNEVFHLYIDNENKDMFIHNTNTQTNAFMINQNPVYGGNFSKAKIISDPITQDLYIFSNSYYLENRYFKNNNQITFNDPNYKLIVDMEVINNNTYMIRSGTTSPYYTPSSFKVFINNIETQYINVSTGSFNSIFVVQN